MVRKRGPGGGEGRTKQSIQIKGDREMGGKEVEERKMHLRRVIM